MAENNDCSADMVRLLYIIELYTDVPEHQWLKEFVVNAIVHLGVKREVFKEYDLAVSLCNFRGIKMFTMISQEAIYDLDILFKKGIIEKLLLNTRLYSPISALRLSDKGKKLLKNHKLLPQETRNQIEEMVRCSSCRNLLDFVVSKEDAPRNHLVMHGVCRCKTKGRHLINNFWKAKKSEVACSLPDFFGIGDVEYKGKPFFLGDYDG